MITLYLKEVDCDTCRVVEQYAWPFKVIGNPGAGDKVIMSQDVGGGTGVYFYKK